MISNYRTQGTIAYDLLRHIFVRDSRGGAILAGKHGMNPRVDRLDNLQLLLQDWATGISNAIGITLFVDGKAYDADPISEQSRCWSHGSRLRLGRFRT